ncbi:MAG: choice-of-anchor D domain-containing protein, partial [Proteobacteria bacterium]|nr:choice-of-anchor D domain-containing protein [Pseudomonadota bacterium]
LSGNVYRLAVGSLSATTLNLGTIRAGGSVGGTTLTVSNSASNDGFSDLLGVSAGAGTGFSLTGGSATLSAGSGSAMSVGYTGDTTTAGLKSGSLTLTLNSIGQAGTGLSTVGLANQYVNATATVFRVAVGKLVSGGSILANGGTLNLGKIREGGSFGTTFLDVRNVVASDSYSESLNAGISGTGGFGSGNGSANLVVAGGTATGALTLGLGAGTFATAGVKSGSVAVGFVTDGTGTSGLGTLAVGTQTVNLTGTVYRLGVGSLAAASLTLAAVREGGTFASGTLNVYNTAATDGLSESLNVSLGGTRGAASIASGSLSLLAAGANDATTLRVSLSDSASA